MDCCRPAISTEFYRLSDIAAPGSDISGSVGRYTGGREGGGIPEGGFANVISESVTGVHRRGCFGVWTSCEHKKWRLKDGYCGKGPVLKILC